jgi:cell division protein FtsB
VLPSDPKLKRKAQNRAAQRAFRERKEQFVNELQEQMRELREAKEKREKELALENARLKKENEQLKEENYLLKDAKFTFEFPQSKGASTSGEIGFNTHKTDKFKPIPIVSPPITDLSSPERGNPPPSESLSSAGSVLSDACEESSKCGELSDYQTTSNSASSVAAAHFPSNTVPEFSFSTDETDLFNGKDNLYLTDYRVPSNESDFLIQNESLPALFGTEMDLFGVASPSQYEASELDPMFSEQMHSRVEKDAILKCAPENQKPCKQKVLAVLSRARGANRKMYQVNQDVKSYCPGFNLDQLCEDLRRKITFDSNHILTDADVDLYIECIQRHT